MKDLLRKAQREQRDKLETEALAAVELRARLPFIVRDTLREVLDEADDLQEARQLAGLDDGGSR